MLQQPTVSLKTGDSSPEAVEKLRLDCFQEMLHSTGLCTRLTWQSTCYSLGIYRPRKLWWPLRERVQTLLREIVPSKPSAKHEWNPPIDCFTESALTSMYRGALDCALGARLVSIEISGSVRYAVTNFLPNLAHGLQAFPIRYEQEGHHFWVVSAKQFTDKDYELAEFIWPGVQIHVDDSGEYDHIRTYVNFFLERYFSGVRSPYGVISDCGCDCLDELELQDT